MATIDFTYFILKDEEEVFKSTAEVKLTKKQLKETEEFIREHSFSPEFVDIPGPVYDSCFEKAYEKAIQEYPDLAEHFEELYVVLEDYIPVSLIRLLPEEVQRKMLTDAPYYLDESEIFPAVEGTPEKSGQPKPQKRQQKKAAAAEAAEADGVREVPAKPDGQPQTEVEPQSESEPSGRRISVAPVKISPMASTLYLPIKQCYFDEIVAGTKREEYREIKPTTYKKYLVCDDNGNPYFDESLMAADHPLCGDLCVWNDGAYPYIPREEYQYLHLAVGYNRVRDEAVVEVEYVSFEPLLDETGLPYRFNADESGNVLRNDDGELCFWNVVYHLGKVIEVRRASR